MLAFDVSAVTAATEVVKPNYACPPLYIRLLPTMESRRGDALSTAAILNAFGADLMLSGAPCHVLG